LTSKNAVTLSSPAQPDDDDMLISRALDELEETRKVVKIKAKDFGLK
jgi:hypothetical protein